ncbi:protein mono-ADP-ribosyltransferase PARP14-like isoform X1 [Erpetoichthys calabaricus]|uniref:protein mono-ADP-ribosyltransferase PARP14-like isoform X1 n=2 Tax=Erpetoichthys calabaricus TaxID=27687 RepID=UPI002234DA7D|nr:protein mono-ADP-ribosyltransferase PARP14-like isoform X1 [Erpetoichthys calabaricus]
MENYPYTVLMELTTLGEKHKERIESYFRIKRKSGGGECSKLKHIDGNLYSISFENEDAQQRVLNTKDHNINVGNETVKITVWRKEADPLQETFAMEENLQNQAASGTQGLFAGSTKKGNTIVQKVDMYRCRYLQDCKDAIDDLTQQLSEINCTVQFSKENDETVLIQMSNGEIANCSEKVEGIFKIMEEKYCCHFETDPKKRQILLKMPHLANKSTRIYHEPAQRFTVMVGQNADIFELLTVVEGVASQDRQGESMKIELRVSKPKYILLCDLFENAMEGQIKITFDGKSSLYLEGTPNAVKKGTCIFQEQLKKILDQTIRLSKVLISFLKLKSTQDALTTLFNTFSKTVTMDIDLDVTLFSLSKETLEEAKKILLTDLRKEDINVPESFKSTPIQEKLMEFVHKLDCRINKKVPRVWVKEDANWQKICVAGFTEEVKAVIKDLSEYFEKNALTTVHIPLQFPQIASSLIDLLNLKGLQFSGVELKVVTNPPNVIITGPQQQVTSVQSSIQKALPSIILEDLVIPKPGAYKCFSEYGSSYLSSISKEYNCVIKFKEDTNIEILHTSETQRNLCDFKLETGKVLSLRQGDITKEKVDAIINAANEQLSHGAGVAVAISDSAGPGFQKECSELVRRQGKIKTGKAVLTKAGKLPCKAVIHAVGPNWSEDKNVNRVKQLLASAIKEALEIAEQKGFRTVAMPCVSCGIFSVPVELSAECIISAVKNFAITAHSVRSITIIDINRDTLKKFEDICRKLLGIQEATLNQNQKIEESSHVSMSMDQEESPNLQVEVVLGKLEEHSDNVLVVPIIGGDLNSTQVSMDLQNKAGTLLPMAFTHSAQGKHFIPGDILPVYDVSNLKCLQVLYLFCSKWNDPQGHALEILKRGLHNCLQHCHSNALQSIALPVVGPGRALGFPHEAAIKALLNEISQFEKKFSSSWLKKVKIVIHPNDKNSAMVIQEASKKFDFKNLKMHVSSNESHMFHSLTSFSNDVTVMAGTVRLQIVHGNIVDESTDIIVNSTDFQSTHAGVSQTILSAAGSEVETELLNAPSHSGLVITRAGKLQCKKIIHVCGNNDLNQIKHRVQEVIEICEKQSFRSVSFPAICTGAGGLQPNAVATAMLEGISAAVKKTCNVSLIRIVLFEKRVFDFFKMTPKFYENQQLYSSSKKSSNSLKQILDFPEMDINPALFDVMGWNASDVHKTIQKLESIFNQAYHEQSLEDEMLCHLKKKDIDIIFEDSVLHSVQVTFEHRAQIRLWFKGLREDVMLIINKVQDLLNHSLKQELLKSAVQWCFYENGKAIPFNLEANYALEKDQSQIVAVMDDSGRKFKVDKIKMIATIESSSHEHTVTRITKEDLASSIPPSWTITDSTSVQRVLLNPSSFEFQQVSDLFKQTSADKTIISIERIQNVFLWKAFDIKRSQLKDKNGQAELNEMQLFHGTDKDACDSIDKNGFNRSLAGQNGTVYGHGVYFAKNSQYSVAYSPADQQGRHYMYLAQVLIGRYTVGNSSMRVPPAYSQSNKNDLFDSLVDSVTNPTIFVVFHDDQVYPGYLITFS